MDSQALAQQYRALAQVIANQAQAIADDRILNIHKSAQVRLLAENVNTLLAWTTERVNNA